MACNPNTVEILGLKPEHYLHLTNIGQSLLDNTKLFLSKRAIQSFGGYADAQLRRLQNALARGYLPQSEKEKHMLNSIKNAMHLLRLFMMALDILEQELLLSIRNGAYQKEDGTYRSEFFEMVDEYEKRLNYAAENTSLPDVPDFKKIETYVIEVNRKGLELC